MSNLKNIKNTLFKLCSLSVDLNLVKKFYQQESTKGFVDDSVLNSLWVDLINIYQKIYETQKFLEDASEHPYDFLNGTEKIIFDNDRFISERSKQMWFWDLMKSKFPEKVESLSITYSSDKAKEVLYRLENSKSDREKILAIDNALHQYHVEGNLLGIDIEEYDKLRKSLGLKKLKAVLIKLCSIWEGFLYTPKQIAENGWNPKDFVYYKTKGNKKLYTHKANIEQEKQKQQSAEANRTPSDPTEKDIYEFYELEYKIDQLKRRNPQHPALLKMEGRLDEVCNKLLKWLFGYMEVHYLNNQEAGWEENSGVLTESRDFMKLFKKVLKSGNLGAKTSAISEGLNWYHAGGSPMEELSEGYAIDGALLDNLTNGKFIPKWNKELQKIAKLQ